jgi:hypothetical protein
MQQQLSCGFGGGDCILQFRKLPSGQSDLHEKLTPEVCKEHSYPATEQQAQQYRYGTTQGELHQLPTGGNKSEGLQRLSCCFGGSTTGSMQRELLHSIPTIDAVLFVQRIQRCTAKLHPDGKYLLW